MRFEAVVNHWQAVPIVHLIDHEAGCSAEIYSFGGLLNAFHIPHKNGNINVIDGFNSVDDAKENFTKEFRGAKLSPYVCRMNHSQYQFDGKTYAIEKFLLDGHAIHGLLYDATFTIASVFADEEKATVSLQYNYEGNDAGYPFPYSINIDWELKKDNHLTVATKITNHHNRSIPVADGWHPYFNLGGSLDDCMLQFNSNIQLEYNAALLPTGNSFADNRFTNGILLKGIELDNSFLFDENTDQRNCILQNDDFVLRIGPGKNYPILQIYIPPHRKSIAIENLSGAPDNFNNKIGLIELLPGKEICFETSYSVKTYVPV